MVVDGRSTRAGACDMQRASILDYRDPAGNMCVCVCVDDEKEKKRLMSRSTIFSKQSYFLELEGVCGYQNYCNQGQALKCDLSQLLVPWMVMLTIMILVLMMRLLNAPHQFLMESAIYGVLDVMIKVLLEMAMLVMVMKVTMMHLASARISS